MVSQEHINLIHKYLENDLTQDEIVLFKNYFEGNPEFAAEVRKYTDVKIALRSAFRMQLESDKDGKVKILTPAGIGVANANASNNFETRAASFGSWGKIAIAASILLLFGIGSITVWQLLREPLHQRLYAAYYFNPLETEQEFFSRSETYAEDAEAIEKFKRSVQYMEIKNFEAATEILESITYTHDSRLMDEVEWYLALCYLRNGKREKAIDGLIQILNTKSVHSNSARNLLDQLNAG